MNKERTLTLQEGIDIQYDQLMEYSLILNEETYQLLVKYCEKENDKLIKANCNDGFKVFRGSDMSSLIKNHAIALKGNGGKLINSYFGDEVYFVTVVDLETMSVTNRKFVKEDLEHYVFEILNGWGNLVDSSCSNRDIDDVNYQMSGTTKDGKFAFSILKCLDTTEA